jgi:mannitol-1-phosphate 5-dehydrogenase
MFAMPTKTVLFGAGATGRGHVGLLAWQSGSEIVFVDSDPSLVENLRSAGHYSVRLYGDECWEVTVLGFRVLHSAQRDAIAAEIVDTSLVLTAVFDQNLSDVARTLALAVTACRQAGRRTPLNCIACENMMNSSSVLGRHVKALLREEDLDYCNTYWGFPDCMISRVVPRPIPGSLALVTEDYNEWTARAADFRGPKPPGLGALELVDNQTARLERKLFIHNGGHAICGYVGYHRGHRYIHEAVADPVVGEHVLGALDELGDVVRFKHSFSVESIRAYEQDLVRRGSIRELRDEILRVVRDPLRKLSPRERLIAPALLAVEFGLPRRWIVRGIVAALRYCHPADTQSKLLADMLAQRGLRAVLSEVCGIGADSPLVDEIETAWAAWAAGPA